MTIVLTPEQELLKKSVRTFFEKEVSIQLVRELQGAHSTGHSKELWNKMTNSGWLAAAVPEAYGGSRETLFELGLVYEEAGRVLLPTSFYSTVFAGLVIEMLGTEEQKTTYLRRIADGKMIGTVAYLERHAFHNPDCYITVARRDKDVYYLSGEKVFVANGHLANPLIVLARTEQRDGQEGLTAFLVPPQTQGVSIRPHHTFGKDKQSVVTFNDVPLGEENVLGRSEEALHGFTAAWRAAAALQVMEMVGGMSKIIEMTVAYVSARRQFGVPIGSFQAVQHHLANMATRRDGSQLLAYQAMAVLSQGRDARREVAVAKAYASESYKTISILAHQLWGGMGYSTESDLYLWSNRAKATELSFGNADFHLMEISRIIPGLL